MSRCSNAIQNSPVHVAKAASASSLPSQEEEKKKESINTSTSSLLNLALSGSIDNS